MNFDQLKTKVVSVTEDLVNRAKPAADAAVENASQTMSQMSSWWSDYLAKNPKADAAIVQIGEGLEEVKNRLDKIADNVSGAAALAEANGLIERQKNYNNILATRLAEALNRIQELEMRVSRIEKKP